MSSYVMYLDNIREEALTVIFELVWYMYSRFGTHVSPCPPETTLAQRYTTPMTQNAPIPIDLAFVSANPLMFANLIEQLQNDLTLPEGRRRDMISGLRRTAKALGFSPEDVPCDSRWLQPRLAKVSPASLRLAPKSWQNAVSDARAALAHFGIVERRFNRIADLAPEWRTLWATVLESGDKTLQPALCRFVHFLNRQGVQPSKVREEHALLYRDALQLNEISKSPETAYRAAVNGWNLAGRRIKAWPRTSLPLASRQFKIKRDLKDFPLSFRHELDQLISDLCNPDPLSDRFSNKALRPATIEQYRSQLIRFASELVHAGVELGSIKKLDILIEPAMAKRGLQQMLLRTDNVVTKSVSETAALLRNLARLLDAPDDVRQALAELAKRVSVKPQNGMTQKNRARLRVLQDQTNQLRLLSLPEQIFKRPRGKSRPYDHALAREDALAIAILLVCPVRVKNLAGIHLEHHLHRPGDGRIFFVLEDAETKNQRPIEFELPRDVAQMLDRHLTTRCPQMCDPGTLWLFPRRDGRGHIVPNALSSRLSKRIRKETGLEMNAHLFRHFAVMNWLDANPGGYEVARRLLGHSEVSHTINMYSGLEARSATKAFADLIAEKKGNRR